MRNKNNLIFTAFIMFSFLILLPVASFSVEQNKPGVNKTESALHEVDPANVCMINNQYFVTRQIPVEVGGKTYFGCCEMCEKTLKTDMNSHFATDPVTGEKVDKSSAVIGASDNGKVYYFKNEKNLNKYNSQLKK